MITWTAEAELDLSELEAQSEATPSLTAEQILLIAGGQCTTNSI